MAQYELNFQDYWAIVRRRQLVIVLTALIVGGLTVYYNNAQTPVYRAAAEVRIERPRSLADTLMGSLTTTYYEDPLVTEAEVVQGRPVMEEVARRLGVADEAVEPEVFAELVSRMQASVMAAPLRRTSIIQIVATASDPEQAYRVANLTAEVYVEQHLGQKNSKARTVREFIEKQVADTEARLRHTEEQKKDLREHGASGLGVTLEQRLLEMHARQAELLSRATPLHPDVIRLGEQIKEARIQLQNVPQEELEYARVVRELVATEESYTILRKKLEEARIAEAERIEDVRIVNTATKPRRPVRPNKEFGYMVGSMLGLMMGLVMAFVVENLDTSLGTIEDVEALLQTPVLGVVPHIRVEQVAAEEGRRPKQRWFHLPVFRREATEPMQLGLFAHFFPKAPETEAFRTLRTNLQASPERKVFLVTSAGPREGKTHIVANLGVVFAQAGHRVLLIASDLRKPTLTKAFGIRRDVGVTEVLAGSVPLEKAIHGFADFVMGRLGFQQAMQTPGLDNLFVLPSGHIPINPSELLGSQGMRDMLARLRADYDIVILDSPPLLPITDGMLLAPMVDAIVLVYEAGRTARAAIQRTKLQVESVKGRVLGIVLNHVRPQTHYPAYYYYGYRYRYELGEGEDAATPPARSS